MRVTLEQLPGQFEIEVADATGDTWLLSFNAIEVGIEVAMDGSMEGFADHKPETVAAVVEAMRRTAVPVARVKSLTDHQLYIKFIQASTVLDDLGKEQGSSQTSPPDMELSSIPKG